MLMGPSDEMIEDAEARNEDWASAVKNRRKEGCTSSTVGQNSEFYMFITAGKSHEDRDILIPFKSIYDDHGKLKEEDDEAIEFYNRYMDVMSQALNVDVDTNRSNFSDRLKGFIQDRGARDCFVFGMYVPVIDGEIERKIREYSETYLHNVT